MEVTWRPAVRIVCLDSSSRVLLLRWQDPYDGAYLWEPPGGGIEAGETPFQAACRELTEETGFDASAIVDEPIVVDRDTVWNGRRFVGQEPFYLARFDGERPPLGPTQLMLDETENLRGHGWYSRMDLAGLAERLEPPTLPAAIAALDLAGPWAT